MPPWFPVRTCSSYLNPPRRADGAGSPVNVSGRTGGTTTSGICTRPEPTSMFAWPVITRSERHGPVPVCIRVTLAKPVPLPIPCTSWLPDAAATSCTPGPGSPVRWPGGVRYGRPGPARAGGEVHEGRRDRREHGAAAGQAGAPGSQAAWLRVRAGAGGHDVLHRADPAVAALRARGRVDE